MKYALVSLVVAFIWMLHVITVIPGLTSGVS